jgi:glycosyltransferase involved in cell wall biosynthesis
MLLALIILGIAALLELVAIRLNSSRSRYGCVLAAVLLIIGTVLLLRRPNVANALIAVSVLYKLFNLGRVALGRMPTEYMKHLARRTAIFLSVIQICILLTWVIMVALYLDVLFVCGAVELCFAVYVFIVMRKQSHVVPLAAQALVTGVQPSVSIAIPARNETDDLEACLRSFTASDYPKLEILALDDCSQTTRTPDLIRQFAHDGVRFIPGKEPRSHWLAKNQAYEALAEAASGEIILFCGVDVRVGSHTVSELVATMQQNKTAMLTVLPQNLLDHGRISMPQTMRYAREFLQSGLRNRRPVALSTCWLISRKALKKYGGFRAVGHKVLPEAFFARQALAQNAYMYSSNAYGVQTRKKIDEQRDTAVRTLYPALHRRPELVYVSTLVQLGLIVIPIIVFVQGCFTGHLFTAFIGLIALIISTAGFRILIGQMYGVTNLEQSLRFVPAVLADVYLLNYSMYKYEFSVVEWKGRNICEPVMHVQRHLPLIK